MRCEQKYNAFFLLSLFFLSCNLFDTRDPENPVTDNQSLPPATSPGILIANFTTAFQQKNIQEYEKLFADSALVFVPTQSAAARYSAVFSSWNKSSESESFRNAMSALGATSTPQLLLTTISNVLYQSDSALFTIDYSVFVPHTLTNVTTQYSGRSEFYFSPNKNNIWTIYRWLDFETKKDSSWSELKGQFAK